MTDYSSLSDEQLAKLCRSDNEHAWNELCLRYIAVAKAAAFKFRNAADVDDLVSEGLVGFLSAVHSFKSGEASFSTYAGVCIRNKIANAVRGSRAGKKIPGELVSPINESRNVADTSMTPEESLVSKEEAAKISKAISTNLTERERLVFRRYLSGNTYNEIADALQISPKAVEGALSRARKKLKSELR